MSFKEIKPTELNANPFNMIGKEWMLVSAGGKDGYNMMTASWGFLGEMWGKPAAITVIRPQRYTKEFMDKNEYFSLSFYGDNKEIHQICGKKSGRDTDKTKETGLTPLFSDNTVYFDEARVVLICKKIYCRQMGLSGAESEDISKWYPEKDYHYSYIGEIVKVLVKE